jgi:predicted dehydrogenase
VDGDVSNRPLRVGIVGASAERGWAKDAHLPALARLPQFTIGSVSAPTRARAEVAARAFGAAHAFDDSITLAKSPHVDVVVVTVRVPDHMPIVMAALSAGKHVFCEWPLGRDVAEAESMGAAAAQAKGIAIVGLQGVVNVAVRRAAEIVRSGALGRIYSARMIAPSLGWPPAVGPHYAYLNDTRNGATLTTIPGGHTLAMVERILGNFTEVQAHAATHHPVVKIVGTDQSIERNCADHLAITGVHASGCVTMVEIGGNRPQSAPIIFEVTGAAGELRIVGSSAGGFQTIDLILETTIDTDPPPAPAVPGLRGAPANVAELYTLLAAACNGAKNEAPTFVHALQVHRLLAAVQVAADTGQRQRL